MACGSNPITSAANRLSACFLIPAICFLVTFKLECNCSSFPSHLLHLANRCPYKDRLCSIFSQVLNIRTCVDESGLTTHDEQLANVLLTFSGSFLCAILGMNVMKTGVKQTKDFHLGDQRSCPM